MNQMSRGLCASVLLLSGSLPAGALASETQPEFVRVPAAPSGAIDVSIVVDPSRPATLTAGRFTVVVPRGAVSGRATVRMVVADPTTLACTLDILPASRNALLVPATLRTDVRGVHGAAPLLQAVTPDLGQGAWSLVAGSTVDLQNRVLSTPLTHFAPCGVVQGNTGW